MSLAVTQVRSGLRRDVPMPPPAKRRSWLGRVWNRRPEPRLRFGQVLLPGYAGLGADDVVPMTSLLRTSVDIARGRFSYEGHTHVVADGVAWNPGGAPAAWLAAHHRLHAMWPIVVAGALAADGAGRMRWYRTGATLVHACLEALDDDTSGIVDRTIVPRRVAALLAFQECFEDLLRDEPALRSRVLARLQADVEGLAARVGEMPSDAWLIATGRALLLAGKLFDGLEARQWEEQGTDVLWAQLRSQIADDGGHVSRSPAWQAFVLEEYAHVLAIQEGELPDWVRKRLKGMCDVLWRTTHPDGELVRLGERAPRGWWSTAELVTTVATLTGEPAIAPEGGLPGALPRLLLTRSARERFEALPRRHARTESRAMRRTGFFVLAGTEGDAMIVDAGAPRRREQPFGYELALAGLPIVVSGWDAGSGGGRLGDYDESARSQNVLVDDRPASGGAAPSASGPEAHWMLRDGFASFGGAWGRHRRLVVSLPGRFWLVLDEVRGVGPWTGESLVHLHPAAEVRVHANGRTIVDVERSRLARARLAFAGSREIRLLGGVEGPRPQGWYARGEAPPQPAPVVAMAVSGTLPICTGYAIVPRADLDVRLDVTYEPMRIGALLHVGRHAYAVDVLQDEIEIRTEVL